MDDDRQDTQAGDAGTSDEVNSLARRQAALRALAQSQTQQPQAAVSPPAPSPRATASAGPPRSGRRGLLVSGLAALVVVALIAVAVVNLAGAHHPTTTGGNAPTTAKPVVRLNPLGDGLICGAQLAWSPDSSQVAVLGNTQTCGASSEGEQSTGIFIYDARTGKLAQQIQPDATLFGTEAVQEAIVKSESNAYNTPELTYTDLVWTPDSRALLLPYAIETSAPNATVATFVTGLMRLGLQSASLNRVWIDSTHPQQSGIPERWDLTTGAPATLPAPAVASAYSWASDGSLAPANAATDGAVGSPIGGQSFTIWQPGYLGYHVVPNADPTKPAAVWPTDILWQPEMAPLSPDGRYYYTNFSGLVATSISLTPPSQSVAPETPIAPRDKALLALAQQMTQSPAPDPQAGYAVAWRPDGKLLAAVNIDTTGAQGATSSTFVVSLYDTATGNQVKQLTPVLKDLQSPNPARETVLWSPDGKRLLLEDNAHGYITIWGPGALPA